MKIAVYTIALNEAHFIERWAKSCEEADYRLIVDTGSTDDTIEVAKSFGCSTASILVKPWRFDDARNAALMLLPDDIDYCISLDADEILMPGWREGFDKLDPSVTRPRYKYVWSSNPDGSERLTFGGDKIHKRHGYRWTHPVHEVLQPTLPEVVGWVDVDLRHYPDPTKSRSQYLNLLELSVKEDPNDDRNLFYLGREYMFNGMYDKAIECLQKHLTLSSWPAERSTGMRYIARMSDDDKKEHWLLRACAEAPERREPWNDLALFYHERGDMVSCLYASSRCIGIVTKPLEYLCEPEAWGSIPYDLAGVSAWNIGLKELGIEKTLIAQTMSPEDERIRTNVAMMYKDLRKNKVGAVIPSKSNINGLNKVVELLLKEKSVKYIDIVCDGDDAYENIQKNLQFKDKKINLIHSKLGDGIHVMWNLGMRDFVHNLFINDDVTFNEGAIDCLAGMLDYHSNIGIICPNYDKRIINGPFQRVYNACPGNYDGTDGLAGFCMMLSQELSLEWEFDTRMKWYYGDNDIVNWVVSQKKDACIASPSIMDLNPSWTKTNDAPKDFDELVEQDRLIFESKWGS